MEAKDKRKRDTNQIKRLDSQKVVVVDYENEAKHKVPLKKKTRTGAMTAYKHYNKSKTPKHGGIQSYFMM